MYNQSHRSHFSSSVYFLSHLQAHPYKQRERMKTKCTYLPPNIPYSSTSLPALATRSTPHGRDRTVNCTRHPLADRFAMPLNAAVR